MASGIVSIGLSLDGQETLSRVTLVVAAAIWVTLAILLPLRAVLDPAGVRADARTPGALTGAAATAVLGTRLVLLGWAWAGVAALVIAVVVWAVLLGPVLAGWRTPTAGVSLLLAVSAESLAVLAATLATPEHARWLVIAALVPFGLGLGLYILSSLALTSIRSPLAAATMDHGWRSRDLRTGDRKDRCRGQSARHRRRSWGCPRGPCRRALGGDDALARGAVVRGGPVAAAGL
jgi:hypothetical protein